MKLFNEGGGGAKIETEVNSFEVVPLNEEEKDLVGGEITSASYLKEQVTADNSTVVAEKKTAEQDVSTETGSETERKQATLTEEEIQLQEQLDIPRKKAIDAFGGYLETVLTSEQKANLLGKDMTSASQEQISSWLNYYLGVETEKEERKTAYDILHPPVKKEGAIDLSRLKSIITMFKTIKSQLFDSFSVDPSTQQIIDLFMADSSTKIEVQDATGSTKTYLGYTDIMAEKVTATNVTAKTQAFEKLAEIWTTKTSSPEAEATKEQNKLTEAKDHYTTISTKCVTVTDDSDFFTYITDNPTKVSADLLAKIEATDGTGNDEKIKNILTEIIAFGTTKNIDALTDSSSPDAVALTEKLTEREASDSSYQQIIALYDMYIAQKEQKISNIDLGVALTGTALNNFDALKAQIPEDDPEKEKRLALLEATKEYITTDQRGAHCWDWVDQLYKKADVTDKSKIYPPNKHFDNNDPMSLVAMQEDLKPGDRLYIHNGNSVDSAGNHSVIFLGRKDKANGVAYTASLPRGTQKPPHRDGEGEGTDLMEKRVVHATQPGLSQVV